MSSPTPFKRTIFVLLALCLIQASVAQSARIELLPNSIFAGTGDSISFDLAISELGDFAPDSLGAFDIDIGFDTSALSFTGYNLGNFLGNVNLLEAVDASAGNLGNAVNIAEISLLSQLQLDGLQPSAFNLATLNFDVINLAAGTVTQLSVLSGAVLGDAFGAPIAISGLGSANVVAVPVPGTLFLLTAALFGWRSATRRRSIPNQVK